MMDSETIDLIHKAKCNVSQLLTLKDHAEWKLNDEITTDKVCKVYIMEIQDRIISKGVVEDVEGLPQELFHYLSDPREIMKIDTDMKSMKQIRQISEEISIKYYLYRGFGPVAQRDFIILDNMFVSDHGNMLINANSSIQLEYPLPQDVVRGWSYVSGFIVEKTGEKTSRVTCITDIDLKGMFPKFIKNMIAKSTGGLASKINSNLKEWRFKQFSN